MYEIKYRDRNTAGYVYVWHWGNVCMHVWTLREVWESLLVVVTESSIKLSIVQSIKEAPTCLVLPVQGLPLKAIREKQRPWKGIILGHFILSTALEDKTKLCRVFAPLSWIKTTPLGEIHLIFRWYGDIRRGSSEMVMSMVTIMMSYWFYCFSLRRRNKYFTLREPVWVKPRYLSVRI